MALDDFGAGYSSPLRLLDLTFDVIKVDGRMLAGVPGDATAMRLLEAVFELASACATDIVAEGVETDAQLDFLLAQGISHAQGFLLGPPMRAQDITALLRRHLAPAQGQTHRHRTGLMVGSATQRSQPAGPAC